ncbi:hypothetical protein [Aurantiacibacter gangjinensis]|uniref:Uncharacterized protein n=1 Tax=Aurantiacibacter gangjinensis TaxID=502682 RepID=A0A0G9MP87_9SPHN|nr:hypothetical protein [Aurantiacibacter gangjinensis]APE28296.1 hypothetical protein BMF35_a1467 [Aurantiacibacter gangjinensis]KLE32537.1 hypothetical protein AAW01_00220 [Aurantiacibacter gangjinensis]
MSWSHRHFDAVERRRALLYLLADRFSRDADGWRFKAPDGRVYAVPTETAGDIYFGAKGIVDEEQLRPEPWHSFWPFYPGAFAAVLVLPYAVIAQSWLLSAIAAGVAAAWFCWLGWQSSWRAAWRVNRHIRAATRALRTNPEVEARGLHFRGLFLPLLGLGFASSLCVMVILGLLYEGPRHQFWSDHVGVPAMLVLLFALAWLVRSRHNRQFTAIDKLAMPPGKGTGFGRKR